MNFTGIWDVVSSPDFDDDYLRMEVSPYVRLRQEGNSVTGKYHLGLQTGEVDGRKATAASRSASRGWMRWIRCISRDT